MKIKIVKIAPLRFEVFNSFQPFRNGKYYLFKNQLEESFSAYFETSLKKIEAEKF